jgi:type IV pilus assembly protein PilC
MPAFAFVARDEQGRTHEGTRAAQTEHEVARELRREGLFPLRIVTDRGVPWHRRSIHLFGPRAIDVEMQLRQLAFMLRTGLTLLQALRVCSEQGPDLPTAAVWRRVAEAVRGGASLHEAMAAHRCFPQLVCSLVDTGERSGNLDTVLGRAADAMARRRQTKAQVLTALAYPTLVAVLASATVAFMMVGVVPKLAAFLGSLGRRLPASTQILVDVSQDVQRWFVPGVLVFCAVAAAVAVAWHSARGRIALERVLLRVPVLGRILRLSAVSTFGHNTALLLASGVHLLAALAIVPPLLWSRRIGTALLHARERVAQGEAMADALESERVFSPLVHSMVATGEISGTLDEVLAETARHHDEVLQELVRRLGAIVEPVILVVIGGIVGFIYFAFFMAIYSITGVGLS